MLWSKRKSAKYLGNNTFPYGITFTTGSIDTNHAQPDSSSGFHHLHNNSLHHSQNAQPHHHMNNPHMINNNHADNFMTGETEHHRRLKVNFDLCSSIFCLRLVSFSRNGLRGF